MPEEIDANYVSNNITTQVSTCIFKGLSRGLIIMSHVIEMIFDLAKMSL